METGREEQEEKQPEDGEETESVQKGQQLYNNDTEASAKEMQLITDSQCEEKEVEEAASKDASKEDIVPIKSPALSSSSSSSLSPTDWFDGLLDLEDFSDIDMHRSQFLQDLNSLIRRRDAILADMTLTEEERTQQVSRLCFSEEKGVKVEELW